MEQGDDATLIAGVWAGDPAALGVIVHRYIRPMVRFAYTLVHSWQAAEDIVQTVFLQFWEGRLTKAQPRNLQAYLYALVRNHALHERRRLAVRTRHQDTVQADVDIDPSRMQAGSPEDPVLDKATLEEILGRLIPQRRHAIRLRYIDQMSFQEIGEILEVSEEAARKLVFRGLQDLREILGVSG